MPFLVRANQPEIILSRADVSRLEALAVRMESLDPDIAEFLLHEVSRADIRPDSEMPRDVARMYSKVEFVDDRNAKPRLIQIVYPHEADISEDRVSILTPIGVALIGLSAGQSMAWMDREGNKRNLRVTRVADSDPPQ